MQTQKQLSTLKCAALAPRQIGLYMHKSNFLLFSIKIYKLRERLWSSCVSTQSSSFTDHSMVNKIHNWDS